MMTKRGLHIFRCLIPAFDLVDWKMIPAAPPTDHTQKLHVNHSSTPQQMLPGSVKTWVKSRLFRTFRDDIFDYAVWRTRALRR